MNPYHIKIDNERLIGILDSLYSEAKGYCKDIHATMKENKDLYDSDKKILGKVLRKDRSSATTSEAYDIVEAIISVIEKVFLSGKTTVTFEPNNKEKSTDELAQQLDDYVNWVISKSNDGHDVLFGAFKNSLIFKNAFLKHYWEEEQVITKDSAERLTYEEYLTFVEGDNVEILSESKEVVEIQDELGNIFTDEVYNVKICKKEIKGKIVIENIKPTEIFISPRATSFKNCDYCCHVTSKSRSDLISQGFDKDEVFKLSSNKSDITKEVSSENYTTDKEYVDKASEILEVEEHYLTIDLDDDGVAELTKVLKVDSKILSAEKVSDVPFSHLNPIPFPNQFFGLCPVDAVRETQKISTALLRQTMDNVALFNNPSKIVNRSAVGGQNIQTLELLKANNPSSIYLVDGDPNSSIVFKEQNSISGTTLPLMEYMNNQKEAKTGVTRYTQGLDANSLNKTAEGISRIMSASQMRIDTMARAYANQLKRFYKQILRIAVENKEEIKDKNINLRGTWIILSLSNGMKDMILQLMWGQALVINYMNLIL